ncbi:beta-lactamase family protein [Mycobacterium sp. MYCO198283]|uniref:serine hydrolase domain-containing protein n=1 Tax=Mycobacterium sp. MYCO198283 TaxID=2883505 RepID=UPI001E64AF07|nr:serine hydrolase domain-containing protein [Mycobacterium sp. MYCO198283]MCG5432466.1 beta-lactamase family protein [Mycobacterium sp. MYCO198283]
MMTNIGRTILRVGVVAIVLAASACGPAERSAGTAASPVPQVAAAPPTASSAPPNPAPAPEFAPISALVRDAIAAQRLPGAVVVVGHAGKVVFRQAYGERKAAGEPGLDGLPAPAEPMTENTIFDIASLTKVLATATAVMQLHEHGSIQFDDPVERYLPGFDAPGDPRRSKVTVRMLLTHTSGETGDVNLGDPWGLPRPDKAEGIRRALTTPLESDPGKRFRYSDINFILLGAIVEKVAGEDLDVYVQREVFGPLGMADSRFLPLAKACGPHTVRGAAIAGAAATSGSPGECPELSWNTALLPRIAPTARDEESRGEPAANPDLDGLLRGTVHDTTARRMGGVAGHAGVFATADDVSRYAQALLDRLAGRPSPFPLTQATLQLMTSPQQPGHSTEQVDAARRADDAAGPSSRDPMQAANYPAIGGQNLRGFGWDIDTPQSQPRGRIFPVGSFGHTGFTGASLWLDPGSDSYVVILANSIHLRGSPPMTPLRAAIATAAAQALGLG